MHRPGPQILITCHKCTHFSVFVIWSSSLGARGMQPEPEAAVEERIFGYSPVDGVVLAWAGPGEGLRGQGYG